METISHQKAHALIQAETDNKLVKHEQKLLDEHVGGCLECGEYAKQLKHLEADLTSVFQARWDKLGPKLSLQAIKERSAVIRGQTRTIKLLGRMAFVPLLMFISIFMFFIIKQQNPRTSPVLSAISPASSTVPLETPAPQTALVKQNPTECHSLTYLVKERDTLPAIAANFGVSEETLLQTNHLTSNAVFVNQELTIPICENVQTTSTTTPTTTSTFAPIIVSASPTPQG